MIAARTATGRLVDLEALPATVDWRHEIAGPLSRIVRFAGQMPDDIAREPNVYSVGEHSVRGAEAVYAEAVADDPWDADRAAVLAFAFLMHDAHEALSGDATRPFVTLAATLADRAGLVAASTIRIAVRAARDHLDAALHAAAGLPWPLPPAVAEVVRDMDDRMLAAEQRHWWHRSEIQRVDPELRDCRAVDILDWRNPDGLDARPWPPARARAAWMACFHRWQPAVRRTFGEQRP